MVYLCILYDFKSFTWKKVGVKKYVMSLQIWPNTAAEQNEGPGPVARLEAKESGLTRVLPRILGNLLKEEHHPPTPAPEVAAAESGTL